MGKQGHERANNVEFVRFAFSLIIVYFHMLRGQIMPFVGGQKLYTTLQARCAWGGFIVECFLIMGGYFLYHSEARHRQQPFIEVFTDRLARLWPVLAFSAAISVIFFGMKKERAVHEVSMLFCTGIIADYEEYIWYIAPYFWSSMLIIALLRTFEKKRALLILAVVAYLGYAVNLNVNHGGLGREVVFSFLSLAFVRVLAGLSLGVLLAAAMEAFVRRFGRSTNVVFWTAVEVAALSFLIQVFVIGKGRLTNMFIIVIAFAALLVSFMNGAGMVGRALNLEVFGLLGRYSYSIYVMQDITFCLLRDTFWKHEGFLEAHVFGTFAISLAFAALMGVGTYHLVEKPCLMLYQRWKTKRS